MAIFFINRRYRHINSQHKRLVLRDCTHNKEITCITWQWPISKSHDWIKFQTPQKRWSLAKIATSNYYEKQTSNSFQLPDHPTNSRYQRSTIIASAFGRLVVRYLTGGTDSNLRWNISNKSFYSFPMNFRFKTLIYRHCLLYEKCLVH